MIRNTLANIGDTLFALALGIPLLALIGTMI